MIRYLLFSFSEAVTNIWRSRVLNVLSIGTIALAMFILGALLLLGHNLRQLSIGWERNLQFHVFLADSCTDSEQQAIQQFLSQHGSIDKIEFLSRTDAQKQFERDFNQYSDVSQSISINPFPASFRVRLKSDQPHEQIDALKDQLQQQQGVEQVSYDKDVIERIAFLGRLVQMAGWLFGAIMIFASVFTISNVLKLTFFARREEVDIMKLVGASRAYIRGPFLLEGFLQGLVGAILGVVALLLGYTLLIRMLANHPANLLADLTLVFLPTTWTLGLLAAGCLSGFIGAAFSLNQFLEEHISYL